MIYTGIRTSSRFASRALSARLAGFLAKGARDFRRSNTGHLSCEFD